MTSLARSVRAWGPIALVVLVVDQITKTWALRALDDRNIDLIWTLRLNLAFNTGMAFGGADGWGPVIGVLGLVVVVTLVLALRSTSGRWSNVAVGLIVGGALGNLVDRLFRSPGWFRGAVVDFIDLQWWPIFNVADMGIVCGGILLVVLSWQRGRAEPAPDDPVEPVAR